MNEIRPLTVGDAEAVADIYAHYVKQTVVTFDTEAPTPQAMRQTLASLIDGGFPAYACLSDGVLTGYCYAHPWKARAAYGRTLETTIYLHPSHTGQGLGRKLMCRLIDECRRRGYHALVACITVPNEASTHLHESLGFSRVSRFREVGCKFGRWLDVADYELLLPDSAGMPQRDGKASDTAGTDDA